MEGAMRELEIVLVMGANSGIARALVRELGEAGYALVLAGRDEQELERTAADVRTRYRSHAKVVVFDALDFDDHEAFWHRCEEAFGRVDGIVLAYGHLPERGEMMRSFAEMRKTIDINYTSAVSLLERVALTFGHRHRGWICGISSVAGDRGRQSNYLYGSSKAAFSAYLQGLGNRLAHAGVKVMTIKPGTVDTPMTRGRVKQGPLLASPQRVGHDIRRAIQRGRLITYSPWYWRWIMLVIRMIPERTFRKLKL